MMRIRPLARAWRAVLPDLSGWARLSVTQRTLLILAVLSALVFGIIGAIVANSASPSARSGLARGVSSSLPPIRQADWHGVPLHPDADLTRAISDDASEYTVEGDATEVGAWFEQAWTGIGLRYDETKALDGTVYRWFEATGSITSDPISGFRTHGHIYGYRRFGFAISQSDSGYCTVTLLRTN